MKSKRVFSERAMIYTLLLASFKPTVDVENVLGVEYFNGDIFYYDFETCQCKTNVQGGQCCCLNTMADKLSFMACVADCWRVSVDDYEELVEVVHTCEDLGDHLTMYGEMRLGQEFPEEENDAVFTFDEEEE